MSALLYAGATLAFVFAFYLATAKEGVRTSHRLLAAAFALMGVQFLLSRLQFDLPAHWLVQTRPVLAMFLPPLLYLHLQVAERSEARLRPADAVHLAGPVFMLTVRLSGGEAWFIDGPILAGLALYAALIWYRSRRQGGDFAARGPALAASLRRWRWMVFFWLVLTLVADTWITFEITSPPALEESLGFGIAILFLSGFFGYALVSVLHRSGPLGWVVARFRSAGADAELKHQLEAHMRSRRPHLDPELSIARLARQLGVPQRQLSQTINAIHGVSFSVWVSQWRVETAKQIMCTDPGKGLLDVLHDSGFQSKSSFNKAFRDLTGQTPSAWRSARSGDS